MDTILINHARLVLELSSYLDLDDIDSIIESSTVTTDPNQADLFGSATNLRPGDSVTYECEDKTWRGTVVSITDHRAEPDFDAEFDHALMVSVLPWHINGCTYEGPPSDFTVIKQCATPRT